jgi:hypothetical protein
MRRILLALMLGGVVAALAADPVKFPTLRSGSTVYSNVTVLSASATDLYIQHQNGFANLKLRYAEPAVQKQFGYDAKAADAATRQVEEHDAQFQARLAEPTPPPKASPARTSDSSVADPLTPASLLNRQAPSLKGLQWSKGAPSIGTNALTLVYFWEAWSVPARKWLAPLQGLRDRLPGAVLLAVSRNPGAAEGAAEAGAAGVPQAVDAQGLVGNAVGVTSVPHLMVVDRAGVVRYNGHPGGVTEEFLRGL